MALNSLTNFWNNKSIKLSDTFDVFICLDNKNPNPERLITCTGFTIPKPEYNEETIEYGNIAQIFLTPKYDACKEITLDFIETISADEKKPNKLDHSRTLNRIFKYMGFNLYQSYLQGLMSNFAEYKMDKYIPYLDIKIMNNKLWRYVYKYHFENLKIVNYTIYNLDNQGESPCKITVTLSFETYKRIDINEEVNFNEFEYIDTENVTPADELTPEETPEEPKDVTKDDIMNELITGYKAEAEAWANGEHALKGSKSQIQAANESMAQVNNALAELAETGTVSIKTEAGTIYMDANEYKAYLEDSLEVEKNGLTKNGKNRALEAFEEGAAEIETWRNANLNAMDDEIEFNELMKDLEGTDVGLEIETLEVEERADALEAEERALREQEESMRMAREASQARGRKPAESQATGDAAKASQEAQSQSGGMEEAYEAAEKVRQEKEMSEKRAQAEREWAEVKSVIDKATNEPNKNLDNLKENTDTTKKALEQAMAKDVEPNEDTLVEKKYQEQAKIKQQMKTEDWARAAAKEDVKSGVKKGDRGISFEAGLTQIDQTEEAYDQYTDTYDAYVGEHGAEQEKKTKPVKTKEVTLKDLSKEIDTDRLSFTQNLALKAAVAVNGDAKIQVPVDRKTNEKTYAGFTAKELGMNAAQYDKDNGNKPKTSMIYDAGLQYVDEVDKSKFQEGYDQVMNGKK